MDAGKEDTIINAKELRKALQEIVKGARLGKKYTVLYRSRPAFRIVPVNDARSSKKSDLAADPLYKAGPLGKSSSGNIAQDHDDIIYGETP